MWNKIARLILKNRGLSLALIALFTVFMSYKGLNVKMSYSLAQMLPQTDSVYIEHQKFKEVFGEEANIFIVGVEEQHFFKLDQYQKWKAFIKQLKAIEGVNNVTSITELVQLKKNKSTKRFDVKPIFSEDITTQSALDSAKNILFSYPIYEDLMYKKEAEIYNVAVAIDKHILNTAKRIPIIDNIHSLVEEFAQNNHLKVHYSGLPYIRTKISEKVKKELSLFLILAAVAVITVLYLLFRSFRMVAIAMTVVAIAVIWTFAVISLLGFEITILTGMIPPLLIVIGVPNSLFLINKYLQEYRNHGNKIKALQRLIQKTGSAIFLTNLTTAAGFGTFIFTSSDILIEFGIVASIMVFSIFLLSLFIVPSILAILPAPKDVNTRHLENNKILKLIDFLIFITEKRRRSVYFTTSAFIIFGFIGISIIKSTGYLVDDIPKDDPIYTDLKFFESNFGGVMPFEIIIDTQKKKGAERLKVFKKIERLEKQLSDFEALSKPISLSNGLKLARQAFFNNKASQYKLPSRQEKNFIYSYLAKSKTKGVSFNSFIDKNKQIIRISYKIKDLGTTQMTVLKPKIQAIVEQIFPPNQYKTSITGTSVVFTKGTQFLVRNLFVSLLFAILLIAFFMALMFKSLRMVIVSLIPNMIPLILTAGLMGYFGIPIKPSTILIFSIAFGISVDDTIHFLAKYRQALISHNWDIRASVKEAIKETGISMFYTSIVLLFGFSIFIASEFGGTVALGLLVSITLFFAMITNLVLLPSLLLSLEQRLTTKAFKEPLLSIFNEEDDIELDHLILPKNKINTNE